MKAVATTLSLLIFCLHSFASEEDLKTYRWVEGLGARITASDTATYWKLNNGRCDHDEGDYSCSFVYGIGRDRAKLGGKKAKELYLYFKRKGLRESLGGEEYVDSIFIRQFSCLIDIQGIETDELEHPLLTEKQLLAKHTRCYVQ